MSELNKTMTFSGLAVLLALLAVITAPRHATPDAFLDQGQPFFPLFTEPNSAVTLEVVGFDEETASAHPFKVTSEAGVWTIPSHHDYPADGKDRLAQTAAAVIELRKDDFRTDAVSDYEQCGVVDPLDETATSLKGRGKRITIRGANGQILADLIVGKEIPDREGMRFVRLPEQKRVYAAKFNLDSVSTKFEDWIEKDLLQVERADISKVVLRDYSIDERRLTVDQRDVVTLTHEGGAWKIDKSSPKQEVDSVEVNDLLRALDELSIVGVRPKPQGLSVGLHRVEEGISITQADQLDLQSKGYYFTRDGRLLSNEGELEAMTSAGVTYTLRFGEILYGRGEAISAGAESNTDQQSGPGENRYLFITTNFDPSAFPEPRRPANASFEGKEEKDWSAADRENKRLQDEHKAWQEQVEKGRTSSSELNQRFSRWYYVISAASFDKLHLQRKDLLRDKG